MKNFKCIFFAVCVLFSLFGVFTSCETTDALSCPYLISNPRVELGEKDGSHKFAGMYFSLFNDSDKTIDNFTLSFMLYDSDGNNPFLGSNCIVSKCDWNMTAGSIVDFIINLDSYIAVVPDEPYIVDYLYVREINYVDGSKWKDPYGMYCVKEAYE